MAEEHVKKENQT